MNIETEIALIIIIDTNLLDGSFAHLYIHKVNLAIVYLIFLPNKGWTDSLRGIINGLANLTSSDNMKLTYIRIVKVFWRCSF